MSDAPLQQVTPSTTRVGWIGTGVMGAAMSSHLLKQGYAVTVHTRTKTKAMDLLAEGARWADSPKSLAEQSDVIWHMKSATAHKNFDDSAINRAATHWRARFNGVTSFRLVVTCREIPSQWAKTVAFYWGPEGYPVSLAKSPRHGRLQGRAFHNHDSCHGFGFRPLRSYEEMIGLLT